MTNTEYQCFKRRLDRQPNPVYLATVYVFKPLKGYDLMARLSV
jgi:hypothetical protein